MIRSTKNESILTVARTTVSSLYEVNFGSPDGIVAEATTELTEAEYNALGAGATYTIVPSNDHNP